MKYASKSAVDERNERLEYTDDEVELVGVLKTENFVL